MPFYTVEEAVSDLQSILLWNAQQVSRAPLSGDPWGSVFYTEYYPIAAGSMSASTLHYADGTSASALFSSVVNDTGTIFTTGSPTQALFADFQIVEYTEAQILAFVTRGLDMLEGRWPRGWRITSGSFTDQNGADPTTGNGLTLSTSRAEIGLLQLSARIIMAEALLLYASTHSFSYRGSGGGLAVDKSRQPSDMAKTLALLKDGFESALVVVPAGYSNGDGASFIFPRHSLDYWTNFDWVHKNYYDRQRR